MIERDDSGKFITKDYTGKEINDNWIILGRNYCKGRAARYKAKCKFCNNEVIRTLYSLQHSKCDCQKVSIPESRIGTEVGCYNIIGIIKNKNKDTRYICKCKYCGKKHMYTWNDLNNIKADKCFHVNKYGVKRQQMYKWKSRRLGCIYRGMIQRCYNNLSNNNGWKDYGAKGIRVCDEWKDDPMAFQKWAYENGYEENLTIDRIDSNGNYCPENCRWITLSENVILAHTKYITINGETLDAKGWAEKIGVDREKIYYVRRKYGDDAVLQYIKDKLQNEISKYDNMTYVYIEVDGMRKTQTEWNRYLKCGKDTIGAYYRTHTLEETQEYIRKRIEKMNK